MSGILNLESESLARLKRLAEMRSSSPEAVFRAALDALEEKNESGSDKKERHPSGKPWPRRNPVGGIIAPV